MSVHKIIAELEVQHPGTDPDEMEVAYPEVEIEFNFIPGSPQTGPSYASGGEPATDPEIEALKVTVINGDGIDMENSQWLDRAQDWLDSKGYDAALCTVGDDDDRSREYFAEYARDTE
jgi:hypothetical protein